MANIFFAASLFKYDDSCRFSTCDLYASMKFQASADNFVSLADRQRGETSQQGLLWPCALSIGHVTHSMEVMQAICNSFTETSEHPFHPPETRMSVCTYPPVSHHRVNFDVNVTNANTNTNPARLRAGLTTKGLRKVHWPDDRLSLHPLNRPSIQLLVQSEDATMSACPLPPSNIMRALVEKALSLVLMTRVTDTYLQERHNDAGP
jgi:hypothetical protein